MRHGVRLCDLKSSQFGLFGTKFAVFVFLKRALLSLGYHKYSFHPHLLEGAFQRMCYAYLW